MNRASSANKIGPAKIRGMQMLMTDIRKTRVKTENISNDPCGRLIETEQKASSQDQGLRVRKNKTLNVNKGLAAGYRHKAASQACCCIQCTILACIRHQKWKTEPAEASRKK